MDKLEQKIRNRLAKDSSMAGIESESLWNAISQASSPAAELQKKRRFILFWVFGAALIGGVVWSALVTDENSMAAYFPRGENEGIQTDYYLVSENDAVGHEVDGLEVSAVQNTLNIEKKNTKKLEESKKPYLPNNKKITVHNPVRLEQNTTQFKPSDLDDPSLNSVVISPELKSEHAEIYENFESDEVLVLNNSAVLVDDNLLITNLFEETSANRLHRIEARESNLSVKSYIKPDFDQAVTPKTKKGISLNIYAGLVTAQNNFKNSSETPGFADSLDTSLSAELGGRLGASYRISKGKNWNLNVGLEYVQWNDRFDKVLISDTLVFENSGSQELSPAINTRTIRHYNKLSSLTVPVELELYKDIESIRFGLGLGTSYSVVFGQEGRLLKDELTVVDYSQSNKRYTNFLSFRATPFIGYKLSEKLMVNALCTIGIQSHGDNSFTNLKENSLTIMPAVGVSLNY